MTIIPPKDPRPSAVPPASQATGPVVFYRNLDADRPRGHGVSGKVAMATTLATLLAREYDGDFDGTKAYAGVPYFVPGDTLVLSDSLRLGIRDERDLFGGVVPFAFVGTKVITHGLTGPDAAAPQGWAPEFPQRVAQVVLPGFSVFSRVDALLAGSLLLESGSVRLKRPDGIGGLGQSVVLDRRQLESQLDGIDPVALEGQGMVLECNLADVKTFSVGQTRLGDMLITYCGTQRLTRSNEGTHVYGGSQLLVARGDWGDLLALGLRPDARTAVDQSRVYHEAALATFTGMFASRCNYDVALGRDEAGTMRSGVLEQSWRIGGATGAELAALAAFQASPDLKSTGASTTEIYGDSPDLPADALIYYQGVDHNVGPLTKFARLEPHVDP